MIAVGGMLACLLAGSQSVIDDADVYSDFVIRAELVRVGLLDGWMDSMTRFGFETDVCVCVCDLFRCFSSSIGFVGDFSRKLW